MMSWSESDLGRGQSVVEDQNGKYVLAGFDQPSIGSALHRNGFYATFRRFTSNGSIDTTFGTSGLLVKSNGTRSDAVFGLALGPDGHYYGGGASVSEGEKHHAGVIYKIAP